MIQVLQFIHVKANLNNKQTWDACEGSSVFRAICWQVAPSGGSRTVDEAVPAQDSRHRTASRTLSVLVTGQATLSAPADGSPSAQCE